MSLLTLKKWCFFQVSLQLTTGNKKSEKGERKLVLRERSSIQTEPNPRRETRSRFQSFQTDSQELPAHNDRSYQKPSEESCSHPNLLTSPHKVQLQVDEDPEILLHTIIMVPDGKNFNTGQMHTPNLYLNCKLFWCNEMARSVVSWGQANPTFNFVQVSPGEEVPLTMI